MQTSRKPHALLLHSHRWRVFATRPVTFAANAPQRPTRQGICFTDYVWMLTCTGATGSLSLDCSRCNEMTNPARKARTWNPECLHEGPSFSCGVSHVPQPWQFIERGECLLWRLPEGRITNLCDGDSGSSGVAPTLGQVDGIDEVRVFADPTFSRG